MRSLLEWRISPFEAHCLYEALDRDRKKDTSDDLLFMFSDPGIFLGLVAEWKNIFSCHMEDADGERIAVTTSTRSTTFFDALLCAEWKYLIGALHLSCGHNADEHLKALESFRNRCIAPCIEAAEMLSLWEDISPEEKLKLMTPPLPGHKPRITEKLLERLIDAETSQLYLRLKRLDEQDIQELECNPPEALSSEEVARMIETLRTNTHRETIEDARQQLRKLYAQRYEITNDSDT